MNYYYNGSVLIGMTNGSIYQRFSYDANGRVVSVDYSTDGGSTYTTYYYLRNAQGDIVKLIDGSGNTVVEYTYDSWDKKLSTAGTLAATLGANQPFRYRGCVYDEETGWYYLQSQYYDPTTGRFISADVYLSTGQGVLGHNAFAYCLNNPICRIDPAGSLSFADILQFFHNLLKGGGGGGGSGGGYGGGSGGSYGGSSSSSGGSSSSSGISSGYSSGASNGASSLAGMAGNIAGGIAAPAASRPDEETEEIRLLQQNSVDGSSGRSTFPNITYPGDDPFTAPPGTEWRGRGSQGSNQGAYYNPSTGESWHPDLSHPAGIGPHWDYNYRGSGVSGWRVFSDGRIEPK